tara:strand:- start:905 stop:1033 length:129 start_codon:yes stop_codon:yes gene_type:complete
MARDGILKPFVSLMNKEETKELNKTEYFYDGLIDLYHTTSLA